MGQGVPSHPVRGTALGSRPANRRAFFWFCFTAHKTLIKPCGAGGLRVARPSEFRPRQRPLGGPPRPLACRVKGKSRADQSKGLRIEIRKGLRNAVGLRVVCLASLWLRRNCVTIVNTCSPALMLTVNIRSPVHPFTSQSNSVNSCSTASHWLLVSGPFYINAFLHQNAFMRLLS